MKWAVAWVFVSWDWQFYSTLHFTNRWRYRAFLVQSETTPQWPSLLLQWSLNYSILSVLKFIKRRIDDIYSLIIFSGHKILKFNASRCSIGLRYASWPRRIQVPPRAVRPDIWVHLNSSFVSLRRERSCTLLLLGELPLDVSSMSLIHIWRIFDDKAVDDDVRLQLHFLLMLLVSALVEVYQIFVHPLPLHWSKSALALNFGCKRSLLSAWDLSIVPATSHVLRDLLLNWFN